MATRSSSRRCRHHGCSLHDRHAVPCYGPGHATNVVVGLANCNRPQGANLKSFFGIQGAMKMFQLLPMRPNTKHILACL